ncbi:MAG TPA: extracellular solute-binding protein [Solirubrobacteraceae bacterium]
MRGTTRVTLALAILAAAWAISCGSSPTAQKTDTGGGKAQQAARKAATTKLQAVYDKVKGLSPEDRRKALVDMAEKEGGKLNVYGSANLDEAEPIMSKFEDVSGIEPNLYRASSSNLLQRILQEAKASFKGGADVVYTNGPEMQVLDDQGLLLPLESPFTKDVVQETIVSKNWVPVYLNAFTPAWNTKRISGSARPASWEDVLTKHQGKLAMEVGDWDWFATLVTQYFEKKGVSEQEAVELFKKAAGGARMVDGHTLMTELLAAGEFDIAASVYKHRVGQLKRRGAPVDWEPAVEPIVIRPNGVGIFANTDVPATALLFADYMLTDVQKMLIDFDRTPASNAVSGGGVPSKYKVLVADLRTLNDQRDKWEALYEEIARESGKVIED